MTTKGTDTVKLAVIAEKVNNIEITVTEMRKKMDSDFITRAEMELKVEQIERDVALLQRIVYGLVSLILLSVIGGLITWYINSPK